MWTGALLVTWFTGLEPTRRDIIGYVNSLARVSRIEQEIESEFVAYQGSLRVEMARATAAAQLKTVYRAATAQASAARQSSDDATAIVEGLHILRRFRNLSSRDSENKETRPSGALEELKEELAAAERVLKEAIQAKSEITAAIASLRPRMEERMKAAVMQRRQLRSDATEAKRGRKVAFELLGQKFDLPPDYAVSAWMVAAFGLILYVRSERRVLLQLYSLGIKSWSSSERVIAANSIPRWCTPVTVTVPHPSHSHGDSGPERPALQSRGFALCCLAGFLAVVCVASTGLLIVKYSGDKAAQWLMAISAVAILALMAQVALRAVCEYAFSDKQRWTYLPKLVSAVAFSAACAWIALQYPRYGLVTHEVIAWSIGLGVLLSTIVLCTMAIPLNRARVLERGALPLPHPARNRRQFILGFAVVAVGILVARWSSAERRHPRFRRKKGAGPALGLQAGLYRHSSSNLVHYINQRGRLACKSDLAGSSLAAVGDQVWRERLPVHGRCARTAFEEILVSSFRGKQGGALFSARANGVSFLFEGVRQETMRLEPAREEETARSPDGRTKPPNLRLFDLAAGMSVRLGTWDPFTRAANITGDADGGPLHFRLVKWRDDQGVWYRRWSHGGKLHWNGTKITA